MKFLIRDEDSSGWGFLRRVIMDNNTKRFLYIEFFNTVSLAQALAISIKNKVAAMHNVIENSRYYWDDRYALYYEAEGSDTPKQFLLTNNEDGGKCVIKAQKIKYKDIINKQFLQVAMWSANNNIYYIGADQERRIYEILGNLSSIPFPKLSNQEILKFLDYLDTYKTNGFVHPISLIEYEDEQNDLEQDNKHMIERPMSEYRAIYPVPDDVVMEYFGFTHGEDIPIKHFLTEHSVKLKKRVLDNLKPVFVKNRDFKQNQFSDLVRKPLPAQEAPILSLVKGLKEKKGLFVVGEMGVGKTFISIATANKIGAKRTVVLCPTHLVNKWEREIKNTVQNAKIINLNSLSISEILALKGTKPEPGKPEFWILGKEQAKLHYATKTLPVKVKDGIPYQVCPNCGANIKYATNLYSCPTCGEVLVSADNTKVRRYAKSLLLKKYFKFDLCIADEVHELKGETAQGQALANLTSVSKKVLALTGTLMGGYASNLFYLLWRVAPQIMVKLGMTYSDPKRFIEKYGVYEDISIIYKENKESIGNKKGRKRVFKEKAGISPLLISYLLENSIYIKLADISSSLPSYEEEVISIEMSEEQAVVYEKFESDLAHEVKRLLASGSKAGLGKMVQSLYALPDGIRRGEVVQIGSNTIVAPLVNEYLTTKEQQLIDIIRYEKSQGRKVLVYLEHTGTRDLMPDLKERLEELIDGIKVDLLYSTSTKKVEERESWIDKHKDNDVLIVNPRLVQTGLDLYDYPSIVFFQTGYSVFTLRQASRRSWRIGQVKPVKVYYLAYANTLQEKALKLMASKMEASLTTEGDLSDKGLVALSESETSMITELARSIIDDKTKDVDVKSAWTKAIQADLFSDATMSEDHDIKSTETTVEQTVVETKVDDRSVKTKFKVVSQVKVENNLAIFKIDNNIYQLKNGKVFSGDKVVGVYIWKTSAKTGKKFAVCKLPNKIVYVGKHRQTGQFVALEIA
jgi:SNF2 family DNA or RNA helicase